MEYGLCCGEAGLMLTHTTNSITVNQFTWDVLDSNSYIIAGNDSALMIDVIDDDELLFYSKRFKKILINIRKGKR